MLQIAHRLSVPLSAEPPKGLARVAQTLQKSLLAMGQMEVGEALRALVRVKLDMLPLPGHGDTLVRWRSLAAVARYDLSLAKLFEGHTDALAIMDELLPNWAPPAGTWAMWAAETPKGRVEITSSLGDTGRISGTKYWCSGALAADHALITCSKRDRGPYLVAVDLRQPGVRVKREGWHAVGTASTASVPVEFDNAHAQLVEGKRAYLDRPGFWQGSAGVAACWYGAACALADVMCEQLGASPDAWRLAHLGATDIALGQAAATLRETASWIDHHPSADAKNWALRARASVESAALQVLDYAGRALGASAFCLNARFAQMAADLPVYLRQSHAERGLAALGERIASRGPRSWLL